MTIATCIDSTPYCANLFYAIADDRPSLVFISDRKTRHIAEALLNPVVAGSIVLETETVGQIRGLQFCGTVIELSGKDKLKARLTYLKRFPYAVLSDAEIWLLKMTYVKLTDNRLGFGKKITLVING
jgi:uncharacterized protein YhbP (UPF0306 family)